MSKRNALSCLLLCLCLSLTTAWAAKSNSKNLAVDASNLTWQESMPGVMIAPVHGDPAKGASHFFLKYAGGLKTPSHHHSSDHYVTLVSGVLTLTVDGADHKLTAGSLFALTNKAVHTVICAEGADCLMSIDSRGKWDVVAEKK